MTTPEEMLRAMIECNPQAWKRMASDEPITKEERDFCLEWTAIPDPVEVDPENRDYLRWQISLMFGGLDENDSDLY